MKAGPDRHRAQSAEARSALDRLTHPGPDARVIPARESNPPHRDADGIRAGLSLLSATKYRSHVLPALSGEPPPARSASGMPAPLRCPPGLSPLPPIIRPMGQSNCGGCNQPVYRTHHCRASVTRNQPEPPTRRPADFWQLVEQAKRDAEHDQRAAHVDQPTFDELEAAHGPDCPCVTCHMQYRYVSPRAVTASQNRGGRP